MRFNLKKFAAIALSSALLFTGCGAAGGVGSGALVPVPPAGLSADQSGNVADSGNSAVNGASGGLLPVPSADGSYHTGASSDSASETSSGSSSGGQELLTASVTRNASPVTAALTRSNGWESGGQIFGQYDITISNSGTSDISGWTLMITVPSGTAVSQNWCCTASVSGTTLTVKPESYNSTVPAGGNINNVGIIASSSDQTAWSRYSISYTDAGGSQANATGDSSQQPSVAATPPGNGSSSAGSSAPAGNGDTLIGEGLRLSQAAVTPSATAAAIPALSVKGNKLVDSSGRQVRLQGVSTHGLQWFPEYVNKAAFQTLRDDWGANVIRLAMYTNEGGYCSGADKGKLENLIANGVSYASDLGMYVIIDWHILSDGNPQIHQNEAIDFFNRMSSRYSKYTNVIYEICNEPNGSNWENQIKPYANAVIPVIRANDPDAIIICGTNTWSQDVDQAAASPLPYDNVMYALHFYAGTHKDNLRNKVQQSIDKGLPIFISECSITDASGNGNCDTASADAWKALIERNGLSYIEWSLCNKNESSAILKSSFTRTSGFTEADLSEAGRWFRNAMRYFAGK